MKRKTFKKWVMSLDGFSRNDADYICDMVGRFGKSYSAIYTDNAHDPCLSGILDSILHINYIALKGRWAE